MKKIIKSTTLADRLLFLFLTVVSVSGILYAREALPKGNDVIIEINGKPAYSLPLDVNATVPVSGPYGVTEIEILDRKVRIREAHCPNRICVKEGWVSRGIIVCLPNRIVVIVGGGNEPRKDIDAITG